MSTTGSITLNRKAFVDASGARFMGKGIALSSNTLGKDLLANAYVDYMRDKVLPPLRQLNANVVRVYQVNVDAKHDEVMNLLAEHDIYVMIGLATPAMNGNPAVAINRMNPIYSYVLYERGIKIADKFGTYPNTFAFSVGNEAVFPGNIFDGTGRNVAKTREIELRDAAAIKSFISDLKRYMSTKGLRSALCGMARRARCRS